MTMPIEPEKQPWYTRWWAIALMVFLGITILLGVTGNLDDDDHGHPHETTTTSEATSTTVAPTTTSPPTTQAPPTTSAPSASAGTLPFSSFTADEWLLLSLTALDPEMSLMCDSFSDLYVDEIANEFMDGFNSTADIRMNEVDAVVYVGLAFAQHCPTLFDGYFDELTSRYPSSFQDQVFALSEALGDVADSMGGA